MNGDEDRDDDLERGQRLDKWLWHARFARTRSAAARLVADGHVRINARRELTCARRVRKGDVLTVSLGRDVYVVRLRAIAGRRGSAPEAQSLYEAVPDAAAGESEPKSANRGRW